MAFARGLSHVALEVSLWRDDDPKLSEWVTSKEILWHFNFLRKRITRATKEKGKHVAWITTTHYTIWLLLWSYLWQSWHRGHHRLVLMFLQPFFVYKEGIKIKCRQNRYKSGNTHTICVACLFVSIIPMVVKRTAQKRFSNSWRTFDTISLLLCSLKKNEHNQSRCSRNDNLVV